MMDIEAIAEKLEPLVPEARRWLLLRQNPEMRAIMERKIFNTAQKVFGDLRKPLLSLPPESLCKGDVHLGRVVYEKEKWEFFLRLGEINRHVLIAGSSGFGKTNAAFHVLLQLESLGIPFLFVDWKRTARHLLPRFKKRVQVYTVGRDVSPLAFNPFSVPPGASESVYMGRMLDTLSDAFTLGDASRMVLQKAISACYLSGNASPTPSQVLGEVDRLEVENPAWKASAVKVLNTLQYASLWKGQMEINLQGSTILEVDGLSESGKLFMVPCLLQWIYALKMQEEEREQLSLVVVLDEAHHFFYGERKGDNPMEIFMKECRELGIGLILIDQNPSLISRVATGNAYAKIFFNLSDASDISKAVQLSLLQGEEWKHFSQLPIGTAICKLSDRWRKAVLIRFEDLKIDKGMVSDSVLEEYLKSESPLMGFKPVLKNNRKRIWTSYPLKEESFDLLLDVIRNEHDDVTTRYKRLMINSEKGTKLKNDLLDSGILEGEFVRMGIGRKLLLRLSVIGKEILEIPDLQLTRESLAHSYWKSFYKKRFEDAGWRVESEVSRGLKIPGRVDLICSLGGKSVQIEIETGKSDFLSNLKNNLRTEVSQICIIATSKWAYEKIERKLSEEGLLIPQIMLVLRDGLRAEMVS